MTAQEPIDILPRCSDHYVDALHFGACEGQRWQPFPLLIAERPAPWREGYEQLSLQLEHQTFERVAHLEHGQELRDILEALDSTLSIHSRPDLRTLVNWPGGAHMPVHRWFRYREGFSPQLISALSLQSPLLDPFCGCGSIMLGAAKAGMLSLGIDVSPLAVFVARTKLRPLDRRQLEEVRTFATSFEVLLDKIEPWPLPPLSIAQKVFEPAILETLLRIRAAIEVGSNDPQTLDFMLLGWLAILQAVGSYFKEGNGIKYRNKKRLPDGYVRRKEGEWQLQRFGPDQVDFVIRAYRQQLEMMVSDASEWLSGRWTDQEVIQGNATDMLQALGCRRFNSIIFSPPYANRFDYFESLKVELWFGGFARSSKDVLALRKQSVRSHLGADLSRAGARIGVLEELIALMDRRASSWRMGVPDALRGYFEDMLHVLVQCRELLNAKGRCCVIVGNSAYAGVIIPTDALIARLGIEAGFRSAHIAVVRHLTVAPQQRLALTGHEQFMRESVVVFE